jgi:hypothetical protein
MVSFVISGIQVSDGIQLWFFFGELFAANGSMLDYSCGDLFAVDC